MPIHINLLAEAQAAEEMRRRDPVKRAMFIGISLVAICLMWSGIVELKLIAAKGRFYGVESAINSQTNAYPRVLEDKKKIVTAKKKLTALQQLQEARFLQGSLLNALQYATANGVQLTRLHEEQVYTFTAGTQPQVNGSQTIPARPASAKEKIILHLDARDYSANPGDQVNKFTETIAKQSYFQATLVKTNGVQLAGPPSSLQLDAPKPYVTFMLNCRYPEVTR